MTSETNDFSEKLRAHRAHMAAVPPAIALAAGLVTDFDGQPMADGEPPRDGLTCGALRTLLAEIERLQFQVKQQQKDAIEAEREFSREARQIAAEARFEERSHHDGAGYF
jgi:hypothetical protein